MLQRVIWRQGDRFRTTAVIGGKSIKVYVNAHDTPPTFATGSLGFIAGASGMNTDRTVDAYLEDKLTKKVVRATFPPLEIGKFEKFEHGKSWWG